MTRRRAALRPIWFIAGVLSFGLGFIGAFLPLLPTVPLMLLAAFCFARSSDRLHDWLLSHRVFGPPIRDWRETGGINLRGKIWASASILVTFLVSLGLGVPVHVVIIQIVVLGGVTVFIWTRPTP